MVVTAVQHSTTESQRQRRLLIILQQAPVPQPIISKATSCTLLVRHKRISVRSPQLHKILLQSIKVLRVLYFLAKIAARLLHLSGGEMKADEQSVTPAVREKLESDPGVANFSRPISQASRRTSASCHEEIRYQAEKKSSACYQRARSKCFSTLNVSRLTVTYSTT